MPPFGPISARPAAVREERQFSDRQTWLGVGAWIMGRNHRTALDKRLAPNVVCKARGNEMEILFLIVQLLILGTLWGILMALKNGFNQVIRGLESIDREQARGRPAGP